MCQFRQKALTIAVSASLGSVSLLPVTVMGQIYVANGDSSIGIGNVAEYTTSGAGLNTPLVPGFSAFNLHWITASGSDLYVTNGNSIGEYNTSGGTINAALVSGLSSAQGIAISGSDLFVANANSNTIGEYNTSGGKVNASLITGLDGPEGIAVSGTQLFVANYSNNSIGVYNTSGGKVNGSLITIGLNGPYGIAVSGSNLFVTNFNNNTIGEYNTTGGMINSSLISGLVNPYGIAVVGTDLFVTNFEGNTIGEFTTSGQKVNNALVSGLDDPAGIFVVGSDFYFTGVSSGSWSLPGNFANQHSGGTTEVTLPTPANNVFLTADSAGSFTSETLNGAYTINALSFTGGSTPASTASITLAAGTGGVLTLQASFAFNNSSGTNFGPGVGILVQANSGGGTISAPIVLGNSQSWEIDNSPAKSLTVSGNISDAGSALSLTKTGSGTLILSGTNTFTGGTNASAGTLTFASPGALPNFSPLSISATATVMNFSGGPKNTLFTSGLTIAGVTNGWTGKLDLGNNDLVIQNGSLSTITNQVKQGYNGGLWTGSGGIVSSAAASNSSHLTTLGVILNTANGTTALYGASNPFDGATQQSPADVLVKYTYFGDANLDGKVDGSDYGRIDNGYLNHLTGWYNGDFNYDGVINGSDYTLIDNTFNTQGARITNQVVVLSELATVPEPTAYLLAGIGTLGLFGRNRQKGKRHSCQPSVIANRIPSCR